jgi:allantoinase
MDADLTLVDLNAPYTLEASDLLYRHRQSPYLGRQMQAKVQATLSRGRVVYQNGKILLEGGGKMVHSLREKG